jgi:cobalt-zinc-cadmium efflux system membrane fusion protein
VSLKASLVCANAVVWLAACGRGAADAPKAAPAKVDNPRPESQLTTLTLTDDAVRRIGIEVVEAKVETVSRTRTVGGEVVAPSGSLATISAPFAGTVLAPSGAALPMAGARVKRSQVVARLLPAPSPSEIASAQARLESARAKARRAGQLVKDGSGSVRAHEEALAELEAIEAVLRAARPLSEGRKVDAPAIQSPIEGVVQKVSAVDGQPVQAGAPLFDVVDRDVLWVRVPLYAGERREVQLREGAEVYDLSGGESGVAARPVPGPPTADPRSATVDAYFELRDPRRLFQPGQRVNVRLKTADRATALVVPWSSVVYDIHGGSWVYENPEPRKFVRRRVEVTYRDGPEVVLSSGPPAGAKVVAVGAAELFGTELGPGK